MNSSSVSLGIKSIFYIKTFVDLTKARLAASVVFSSIVGYLLAVESFDLNILILLTIGGYCMVGASNSFNQIIERDIDALMDRTKNRPIPSVSLSVSLLFSDMYLGRLNINKAFRALSNFKISRIEFRTELK